MPVFLGKAAKKLADEIMGELGASEQHTAA
jgi:hypothetical protein